MVVTHRFKVWVIVGFCFYCLERIAALQPGGSDVMHVDGTRYCGNLPWRKALL